jgi:diguanylate cyclase (GGDEF)-like protein
MPDFEQENARLRAELEELKRTVACRGLDYQALYDASRLYSAIINALPIEVVVLDAQGTIVDVNEAWQVFADREGLRLSRYGVGQNYLDHCLARKGDEGEEARRAREGIRAVLDGSIRSFSLEYPYRAPGKERWFCLLAAPISAERFRGAVLLHLDITERVAAEARAGHLANHDPLTGLPNRRLLTDRLQQVIAQARRRGDLVALLYIDLDNFKYINDRFGHQPGDAVLREIADRMRGATREADTLARTGGDEFTLVAAQLVEPAAADLIAGKLIGAVVQPLEVAGEQVVVGASVGIALWPEDGDTADQLERRADEAMYRAKQAGKNRYQRWSA